MPEADRLDIVIASTADEAARSISNLASQMSKLSRATSTASKSASKISRVAKDTANATHEAGEQAEESGEKVSSFGKKISGISIPFNKFSKVVGGLAKATGIVGKSMAAMPRYFGGRLISRVKDATKSMTSFFGSIKRIAFYRGIRTALKLITQGFSQGIANMYNWSKTSDGVFAASMDRLASSSQYLSNSLGAMAAPLINSLAPAIEYIIDRIVALINMINMLFAILSGSGTYTVATKTAAGWGKAAKGAGGAAKEVKKTLLAWDELNKLTDNSGGGGGGGGGGAGGLNFEQRTVNEWLKNAIENGNWDAIGVAIANKINRALDSINWDAIRVKATGFASGLAGLINGVIRGIKPDTIGKTIGELINTATATINTFFDETHWKGMGYQFKLMIEKALGTIDSQSLARALNAHITAALKFLQGLLPSTYEEWKIVVGHLVDWLNLAIWYFPKDKLADVLARLINGALALINKLAEGNTLTNLINAISDTIQQAAENVDKQALADAIKNVINAIFKMIVATWDLVFKIGKVNPAVGAIATGYLLLKSGILKFFGSMALKGLFKGGIKLSTLGKGLSIVAGIAVMVDALVGIHDVLSNKDNMSSGEFVENLTKKLGEFLIGLGFTVVPGHPLAGGILITVGLLIQFAPKVVEKVEEVVDGYLHSLGGGGNYEYSFTGVPMKQQLGDKFGEFGAKIGSMYDKYSYYMQDQYETAAIQYWNLTHNPDGTPKTNSTTSTVQQITNNYYYTTNNAGATLTPTSTTKNPTNGQTVHYTNTSLFTAADSEVTVTLKKGWNGSATRALGVDNLEAPVTAYMKVGYPNSVQIKTSSGKATLKADKEKNTKNVLNALGGAFYGGFWHSIPQYAGGTLSAHGSLFLAGEAGPEIVGHVGGRTEVLNKSQLASAMFSAVRSAMAPVAVGFASAAASLRGYNEEDMAEMLDLVRTGNEARQAQNAILREQTQYLREINDKDFTADVTTASINKAQARMNRRAGVTVSPVGR